MAPKMFVFKKIVLQVYIFVVMAKCVEGNFSKNLRTKPKTPSYSTSSTFVYTVYALK